jgi:hypothetical protein|tara:strand:- start:284 stop:460 length:177 start_codon:yes stop_codon:yes gene_type:complete
MKNIPPSAAVENIGQWTKVRTSIPRKMKLLQIANNEGYESRKVWPLISKLNKSVRIPG